MAGRPDYGFDAPGPFLIALIGGALFVVGGIVFDIGVLIAMGIAGLAYAAVHVYGSKFGKRREATRLLDGMSWRGDEQVLDVGCGHGLLLINAAQRLTTGRAVGIDLWSQKDQWHNSPEATVENARRAGVADRVDVRDGDARNLEFPDASFDVVVSSLVIHNIPSHDGRAQAIREIARVLKPGGRVGIIDIAATGLYQRELARAPEMTDVRRSAPRLLFSPSSRVVTARKA